MRQEKPHYVLDFTIPAGATGPQGETGATGPTGPTCLKGALSLDYNNLNTAGIISISNTNKNMIIPVNSPVFTLNINEVILNEEGLYEFMIYGLLKEATTSEGAEIILKVGNENLIVITLIAGVYEIYFSRTSFKKCNQYDKVVLQFNKANTSNAVTEGIYLIIKNFSPT